MKKRDKIIYWASTGLLSLFMLFTAIGFYILNHDTVVENFNGLGFPEYLIYPIAIAKILGVIAILSKKSNFLKYLAYAGFFYDFLLAISAHINAGDEQFPGALFALVLLIVSYIYDRKLFATD